MNNAICDQCETLDHCAARGCIPVTQYDASVSAQRRRRLVSLVQCAAWFAVGIFIGHVLFVVARALA